MAALHSRWLELMEVVTVGLPFCGFKLVAGFTCGDSVVGWLLVALGAVDVVLNLANAVTLLSVGRRSLAACTFALLTSAVLSSRSREARLDVGNAVDTLFSFTLVAGMIGGGFIGTLPASQLQAWNVCVIINVLGAGLGRLGQSLRSARGSGSEDARPLH